MTVGPLRRLARACVLAGLGGATTLILLGTDLRAGVSLPPSDPTEFVSWWSSIGTDRVVFAAVHSIASASAMWLTASAALAVLVQLHPSVWSRRLYRLVAPMAVRSALGGSVIGIGVAGSAAATPAAESMSEFILADAGPAAASTFELTDQGLIDPRAPTAVGQPLPPPAVEAADTWTVVPGDHLWHVAESTLQDRGVPTDDRSVGHYLAALIDANRSVVGDDPDLIHPGDTIVLPD